MPRHSYLKSDFLRLIQAPNLYIAITGVVLTLFFAVEDAGYFNNGVLAVYTLATEHSGMMIAYTFCAVPFATSFSKDIEKKYCRYMLIRENIKYYVISKMFLIYISSMVTMVSGTACFVLLMCLRTPWLVIDYDQSMIDVFMTASFGTLIRGKHYFLYCLMYSIHLGMLAGILSTAAAFLSLFVSNKVTVLVVPI